MKKMKKNKEIKIKDKYSKVLYDNMTKDMFSKKKQRNKNKQNGFYHL